METNLPFVSVIVSTYNRAGMLGRLLQALAAQTYPASRFEVVVVADGCTDGTAELVRGVVAPYRLELVDVAHGNLAAARNAGAARARGELLVFMDDDMQPVRGLLVAYVEAHAGRSNVAL